MNARDELRGVFEKLRAEGVSEERLQRVHAPIGVAVGAVTPEEIAVSILAEMTAVRRGGHSGREGAALHAAVRTTPAGGPLIR